MHAITFDMEYDARPQLITEALAHKEKIEAAQKARAALAR